MSVTQRLLSSAAGSNAPGPECETDFDGPDRPTVEITRVYITAR